MVSKTRTLVMSAIVLALGAVPVTALADGHTNAFPGNKGYVGHVSGPQSHKVERHHGHHYAGYVRKRKRPVEVLDVPGCPPNFYGLYRGTLYCNYGKPLH